MPSFTSFFFFFFFYLFLATLPSMRNLPHLGWNLCPLCIGNAEFQPLDNQGSPSTSFQARFVGQLTCLHHKGCQERLPFPSQQEHPLGRVFECCLHRSAYLFINLGIIRLLGEQKGHIGNFYEHEPHNQGPWERYLNKTLSMNRAVSSAIRTQLWAINR